VRAVTRRGQVEVPARVTKDIKKGVTFMPFHYKECAANVLTNNALDPVAKIRSSRPVRFGLRSFRR